MKKYIDYSLIGLTILAVGFVIWTDSDWVLDNWLTIVIVSLLVMLAFLLGLVIGHDRGTLQGRASAYRQLDGVKKRSVWDQPRDY